MLAIRDKVDSMLVLLVLKDCSLEMATIWRCTSIITGQQFKQIKWMIEDPSFININKHFYFISLLGWTKSAGLTDQFLTRQRLGFKTKCPITPGKSTHIPLCNFYWQIKWLIKLKAKNYRCLCNFYWQIKWLTKLLENDLVVLSNQ